MVKDDSQKIPTLIEFSELFLRAVKVESLLISRQFFGGFWMRRPSPTRSFIATPIFTQMEAVEVVHMPCKFRLHLTCHSRVFIFQKFSCQFKVPLQAASGWFFIHPTEFQFVQTFRCVFVTNSKSFVLRKIFLGKIFVFS